MNLEIQAAWKRRAADKAVTVQDTIAYCAIRAIFAKSNDKVEVFKGILMKSFTPWTNLNKIEFQTPDSGPLMDDEFYTLSRNVSDMSDTLVRAQGNKLFGYSMLTDAEKQTFGELISAVTNVKLEDPETMFFWVDKTLPKVQQVIQVAHMAYVIGMQLSSISPRSALHINRDGRFTHFVVYEVVDTAALYDKEIDLLSQGVEVDAYFDTSVNGVHSTAIATYPMRRSVALRRKIGQNETLLVLE